MQEKRVQVNQIELQIREYKQEGDAIIFLHFGGANLMIWQRIIPYFEDRYHLILVDLRGHGKSDKPATGYHIDEMASDFIGIVQHLKLERVHVVGSSLGAEVGLSMAVNYPEKVISCVCEGALFSEYGPYGLWEGSEAEFEEHVADRLEKIRNTPETVYPSVDALLDARRELFEKYGWWNEYMEAVERYGIFEVDGKYAHGMGKQVSENYVTYYFHYRFEDYYRKATCPLLLVGEEELDNERERTVMRGLSELAMHGELVELSGWMHPYGWLLNPEGVSQVVLKFLDDVAQ